MFLNRNTTTVIKDEKMEAVPFNPSLELYRERVGIGDSAETLLLSSEFSN
jgi:hypothetical protein